jgi:hypothetical protein
MKNILTNNPALGTLKPSASQRGDAPASIRRISDAERGFSISGTDRSAPSVSAWRRAGAVSFEPLTTLGVFLLPEVKKSKGG